MTDGAIEAADTPDDGAASNDVTEGTAANRSERPGPGPTDRVELSKDVVFDILRNERRRRTLEFLRDARTTTLSDLAEHVAARENDKPVRDLTSSERKRVYVSLYQCHLQKMAEAGVIDYDRSRGTVELRGEASQCFLYLDIDPGEGTGGGRTNDRSGGDGGGDRPLRERLSSLSSLLDRD